jgi:protoporphyrinogen oxidase
MTKSEYKNTQPIVIIGAGPAGLTASYELSKLGMKSAILEADAQVGGLSRTVNYRGYRFDIGGHRFFSKVPYIKKLWNEILKDEFVIRSRLSRIHYRGDFFAYPLKPFNALRGLGPLESFLVFASYSKARVFSNHQAENFEQWVSSRFGYRLYNIFFKTYTEKVWGIPCQEISVDWAAQRIKNLSLKEAVRNSLFGNNKEKAGETITSLIEQFHYPRLGPGMMWERCEELLANQGNATLHGVKVERVRHRNGHVDCIYACNRAGEWSEFSGQHFISSMPLKDLLYALDPPPPDKVLEAANRLRYRDYLTVVLIVNRENVFPDNWIYIHTPDIKMGRIQNYKNWSREMVPDETKTSLGLEYFLWEKDEEWNRSKERLIEQGIHECSKIGLIAPDEIEDGTVVRMKKAYPVYDQNYHESLETIRQYLESFKNLQTIGRNGLHRYNNQDHSMLTGVYAARNVSGEKHDVWRVNTEDEYQEEGEIEEAFAEEHLKPERIELAGEEQKISPDEVVETAFARLDPTALGLAVGLVCGLGLFLATAALLLKGGPVIGPKLSLLGQYLIGYKMSWPGAFIGSLQSGVVGFLLGHITASLRNWTMITYASFIRRRAVAAENRDLLDKL